MARRHAMIVACLAIASLLAGAAVAAAQETAPPTPPSTPQPTWPQVKCERYTRAWTETLARRGTRGLGQPFLDAHQAFLDSGCTARADVCPRSPEELELANIMVIRAMNAGTSSTFLPFACRR